MDSPRFSIPQAFKLPIYCALCKQQHRHPHAVCEHCHRLLEPLHHSCYHCALPLPSSDFLICGLCIKEKPAVDHAIAAYRFEEPLRRLLHAFKYQEGLYLCSYLAHLLLDKLDDFDKKTQCLIPVPLHPLRLKQRGFNQAALLAQYLGRQLKIPCDLKRCSKQHNTPAQAQLSANERRKNLHNAFHCPTLPYQHVTLIDDLLTTGSTVNELAKTLKQKGVQRVDVWACAKAVLDDGRQVSLCRDTTRQSEQV